MDGSTFLYLMRIWRPISINELLSNMVPSISGPNPLHVCLPTPLGGEIPQGFPMVVISNYVLDSLLTDGYQIVNENGIRHFYRSRVSIYSSQEEEDPANPDIISRYWSIVWWNNCLIK